MSCEKLKCESFSKRDHNDQIKVQLIHHIQTHHGRNTEAMQAMSYSEIFDIHAGMTPKADI